jgi:enterochelin esterase family protein
MPLARTFGCFRLLVLFAGALSCSSGAGGQTNTGTGGGDAGRPDAAGSGGNGSGGASVGTGGGSGGASVGTGGGSGGAGVGTGGGSGGTSAGTGGDGAGTAGRAGSAGGGRAGSTGGANGSGGGGVGGGGRGSGSGGVQGGGGASNPGTEGDGQINISSPFKADPAQTVAAGVTRGRKVTFSMDNSASQFYASSSTRSGTVYVPAGYTSGKEVPFMVAQDGSGYVTDVSNALDTLINDKRVPAMAVIFIDPGSNRSGEYDTVSDKYTMFIESEVLAAAKAAVKSTAQLDLNLTTNPDGRGSMGGSSGGAAAFTMGWFHPELYRKLLTYSGSFVKLAPASMYPNGAGEYPRLIGAMDMKPLRVFLASGTMDLNNQFGVWLDANDAMFAALTAKGYHTRYIRATGAMHVDGGVRRQTLADALTWLWRGYPIN